MCLTDLSVSHYYFSSSGFLGMGALRAGSCAWSSQLGRGWALGRCVRGWVDQSVCSEVCVLKSVEGCGRVWSVWLWSWTVSLGGQRTGDVVLALQPEGVFVITHLVDVGSQLVHLL